jgi:hypothetical protein
MGKSDPYVFQFYKRQIPEKIYRKVAFLGFSKPNFLTDSIQADQKRFFDLSLGNWNINDQVWNVEDDYDMIVCTRCPYFSKNPKKFIENCIMMTQKSQSLVLFLDWGLGDHWRFDKFKVGWVKDNEHEYAYDRENLLWSCIWSDKFLEDKSFIEFSRRVLKFGYSDVKKSVYEEVPSLLNLDKDKFLEDMGFEVSHQIVTLWEDRPQLYISLLIQKSYNIT